MTSSVSECDTKNTNLSKLGSYRISDTAQYVQLQYHYQAMKFG